ncbi:DUF4097 family beta strand repeat-containing protein [Streptacidiphilus sp. MAP5-3]|uniref:DUF4097 family beta strand repeat-containing protein n=1 Tax=unclassified Streptacidiphilus TaxID=2643834 RepID=UPI003513144E
MTPRRGLWYGLATLVVVGLSASFVVSLLVQQQATDVRSYPHDTVTAVDVVAPGAAVVIQPGPGGQAQVTENLRWFTDRPHVSQSFDPKTGMLSIQADCKSAKFLTGGGCSVELDISVPPTASVHAVSDSGATTVKQMAGPVDVQTASGAIESDGVSGQVSARADSGAITANALLSDDVAATATSGAITLDFAAPPATVTAGVTSGALDVQLPRGTQYRVVSTAGSGPADVDPGLSSTSAVDTVTTSSTSGEVAIGYR